MWKSESCGRWSKEDTLLISRPNRTSAEKDSLAATESSAEDRQLPLEKMRESLEKKFRLEGV